MSKGVYKREGVPRGKYNIYDPFEKDHKSWIWTLLFFGVNDNRWIPTGEIISDGPRGETKELNKNSQGIPSSTWSDMKRILLKEGIITDEDKNRRYNIELYQTSPYYWKQILRVISQLVKESLNNLKYLPTDLSATKSESLHQFKARYKQFVLYPDENTKKWLIKSLQEYFRAILNDKDYVYNKSVKELLHDFLIAKGDLKGKLQDNKYGVSEVEFHYFADEYTTFYLARPEWLYATKFDEMVRESAQHEEYEIVFKSPPKNKREHIIASQDSIHIIQQRIKQEQQKIKYYKRRILSLKKKSSKKHVGGSKKAIQ